MINRVTLLESCLDASRPFEQRTTYVQLLNVLRHRYPTMLWSCMATFTAAMQIIRTIATPDKPWASQL